MTDYLSFDGLRVSLVLIAAIGQALMAYWPELRRWPETTPSRSAALRSPVVPIEWAFAIWGLLFLGCVVFGVWQALPAQLDDPLARTIGWWAFALFVGNILWEAWVPKRSLDWVSAAIIVVELALVLVILFEIARQAPEGLRFWLAAAPFQLLGGWIAAATFVNIASTLMLSGARIGTGISLALIAGAGLLGAGVAYLTGAWLFAAAVGWALFGVIVANLVRERNLPVAACAGAMLVAVVSGAVLAG